jgi:hypothetical protein
MYIVDICNGVLFLPEDITCGKKQIDMPAVHFGVCYRRFGRSGLGIAAIVRVHVLATQLV